MFKFDKNIKGAYSHGYSTCIESPPGSLIRYSRTTTQAPVAGHPIA